MTTIHHAWKWTTLAVVAMLSDDPVCDTCRGHGRIEITGPRDLRSCPACGGRGIPRTLRDWTYDSMDRHSYKAYRQIQRSAR
jgi:DnaJ-class molecular chaperone